MSKIADIFNYFRKCPQLSSLWSIAATEDAGVSVILPQGASEMVQYQEQIDALGNYECDVVPYPSVYEDYQINCYVYYDSADESEPQFNVNVLNFDEVQAVCDWVQEQNETGNLPDITGKQVVSVECNPFVPQIRYINSEENTLGYFITVRIRYVNSAKARTIYFDGSEN